LNSEYIIRLKKKIQKHGMNPMRQGVDLFTGWKLKGRRKKKVVQLAMVQKHIGKTIFEFMPSQQKIKPLIFFGILKFTESMVYMHQI
jgi:hypothetical protein